MKTKVIVWVVLFVLAVGISLASKFLPYLPGDVACATAIQSLQPEPPGWAGFLAKTAEMPWLLGLVCLTFCGAWAIAGWRAALLSLASIGGMWLFGMWLAPLIGQPRPSASLIYVAGSPAGSAFPSQFALRYAATFGFLAALALLRGSGVVRWVVPVVCIALLAAGAVGRLLVGAHWPSDLAGSYLLAGLWVALVLLILPPMRRRHTEAEASPD